MPQHGLGRAGISFGFRDFLDDGQLWEKWGGVASYHLTLLYYSHAPRPASIFTASPAAQARRSIPNQDTLPGPFFW